MLEGFAGEADNRRGNPRFRWPENVVRVREVSIEKATVKVDCNPRSKLMEVLGRCLVEGPERRRVNIAKAS